MSQYRSLVGGVSQLFRDGPEQLDDHQRLDTAGLLSQVVEANEQLQQRLNEAEHMLKRAGQRDLDLHVRGPHRRADRPAQSPSV